MDQTLPLAQGGVGPAGTQAGFAEEILAEEQGGDAGWLGSTGDDEAGAVGDDGGVDPIDALTAWTWILHLSQPEAELRLPERMRG